eukprot:CAMPEP_0181482898 /NCGR_PEP_ID=MMETSP1110-20121109/45120_1 /TAXON_ID=174948 /ORGANISM="Symbiodinium sp., Strain CCMP421" /LENGTH=265 /DNA_ID=CAMNT_0023608547 /DNA_START=71 /DNA_END=864 /DNA_ORIENTATION=+
MRIVRLIFLALGALHVKARDDPKEVLQQCTGRLEEKETFACPDITKDYCAKTYTAAGGGAHMQCGLDGNLCLNNAFCETTTTTTLPGYVLVDDDGRWVKINQWSQGVYERQTNAYGTVRTSGPGDGKLDDKVINELMAANLLRAPSGEKYNVFKVTAKEAGESYYIRVKGKKYIDTVRNFNFPRHSAYQYLGEHMPDNMDRDYKDLVFNCFDAYHHGARESCNRFFMCHDSSDDCYKADLGTNTNKRCFSGGHYCRNALREHHPP